MVLAKMNNYKHQLKPTYASYTFQVLMGFWYYTLFLTCISEEGNRNRNFVFVTFWRLKGYDRPQAILSVLV